MPTSLPRQLGPLWPAVKVLIGAKLLRWQLQIWRWRRERRTRIAQTLMRSAGRKMMAADRQIDRAIKIAPWLEDGAREKAPRP